MILVVVEHEGGTLDRLSSEALTLGRSLAEAERRAAPGRGLGSRGRGHRRSSRATGVAAVHEIADPRLADYAPEALGAPWPS